MPDEHDHDQTLIDALSAELNDIIENGQGELTPEQREMSAYLESLIEQ